MNFSGVPTIWLVFGTLLIAGCVSAPAPIPPGYAGPLATVTDTSTTVSSTKIQFFQLAKVDGRGVATSSLATYQANQGKGFYMEPVLSSREIPAQECVLSIEGVTHVAADILAFGGGMFHVEGDVKLKLEPGKTYVVKGELSKEYSAVWLEDSAGKIVSTKIEKRRKQALLHPPHLARSICAPPDQVGCSVFSLSDRKYKRNPNRPCRLVPSDI